MIRTLAELKRVCRNTWIDFKIIQLYFSPRSKRFGESDRFLFRTPLNINGQKKGVVDVPSFKTTYVYREMKRRGLVSTDLLPL